MTDINIVDNIDKVDKKCNLNCRRIGYNQKLSLLDPASQYQTQKIIWNTVRVPATLYMSDLSALTVYQSPGINRVNWNQMSDRRIKHVQPSLVGGGSYYHTSSTKHTITRLRPGAGSPGGAGVDIKHNSYARYLRRLVGKGPARRGVIFQITENLLFLIQPFLFMEIKQQKQVLLEIIAIVQLHQLIIQFIKY